MKNVIFTFSIIVAAGLGYIAGKNSNSANTVAQPEEVPVQQPVAMPSAVKPPPVITENIVKTDVKLPLGEQNEISYSSTAEQTTQNQLDALKAEYDAKQRSESFTNWLTKNQKEKPWFDLGVEMRGRFEVEEIDHEWASSEEGHIQSLFTQKEELSGIAVKSTNCKSTQCKITISVVNQDHANETAMAITKILGAEKFSHIIIDNQAQQGESTFYIARDEKGFEFN
jgi:hypothetical protein